MEIGALGGYSGLCLARGLGEKGRIVSLELKEAYAALAHRHMENNGYGDRVEYRIGPAADSLKELQEEGRTFDFFFIDADKEKLPSVSGICDCSGESGCHYCGRQLFPSRTDAEYG